MWYRYNDAVAAAFAVQHEEVVVLVMAVVVVMMMMMTTANNNNNDGDLLAMTRPSRWRARLRVKQPSDRATTTFWASCHTLPGGSG